MSFQKNDTDKNRLELLDYDFVEGIGRILTFGAIKYEAWNWQKAGSDEDLERLRGALMRHSMAYMRGEKLDPETGESHLSHMGCCMMFLDYFDRQKAIDKDTEITTSIDATPTHAEKQGDIRAVRRWLENSPFSFRNIDTDGGLIFNNHDTGTQFAMKNYNHFFDWLVKKHPEVYIRNGGSRAFAEKVANES